MKIYTENQIREFLTTKQSFITLDDIYNLDSIELPSDEEIDNEWKVGYSDFRDGCNRGAKWLRDEIGGNNQQQ